MAKISASDVAKLRKMTGAGMMDCKNALTESDCDFDQAIDILRKKGQKVAGKRADRDASEGAVLAKNSIDGKRAAIISLNCETDFVAKNDDFVKFANQILDLAIEKNPATLEELLSLELNGAKISEEIINQTGVIGEKVELAYYDKIEGESVSSYIHMGNKLATIAGFSKAIDENAGKDIVMQIAAMNPVAVDKDDVPQNVIDKEIEIGKELAIQEGKPADLAEKIAVGRLNKFFKESTLLNQQWVKDNKKTIRDFLKEVDAEANVLGFKRYAIG
ncbi:MAG: translation elongation factor Ts [Bacteroidales bacterium]|nr:translation elongation factor Ts [Bacteroidales bacterium]